MSNKNTITPLLPDKYYHIYNYCNDHNEIFLNRNFYLLFLEKYEEYLSDYLDTYAYCILPDHFHFLVRIKPNHLFSNGLGASNQLRKFFISYSLCLNKRAGRSDPISKKYYRKVEVDTTEDLKQMIMYIHYNPQKHGICKSFDQYYFSSFKALVKPCNTKLRKKEVLSWFNGLEGFLKYHWYLSHKQEFMKMALED